MQQRIIQYDLTRDFYNKLGVKFIVCLYTLIKFCLVTLCPTAYQVPLKNEFPPSLGFLGDQKYPIRTPLRKCHSRKSKSIQTMLLEKFQKGIGHCVLFTRSFQFSNY